MSTPEGAATEPGRALLQVIYDLARRDHAWPPFQVVDVRADRQLGIEDSNSVLAGVASTFLRSRPNTFGFNEADIVQLTLRGVDQCDGSSDDLGLLVRFIQWVTEAEQDPNVPDEGELILSCEDFAKHLGWSVGARDDPLNDPSESPTDDVVVAREAMQRVHLLAGLLNTFFGSSGVGANSWQWSYSINRRRVRIYRGVSSVGDLLDLVEPLDAAATAEPDGSSIETPSPAVDASADFDFDLAVSFAGEDRPYVEGVVSALEAAGVRVFYDIDQQAEMWGEDLVEYFDGVYRLRSRFVVLFVSRHYAEKMWTRLERRSALARGLGEAGAYVLPVRLDDTQLPGLRPTVAYLDARVMGQENIVNAALRKLERTEVAAPSPIARTPRTEIERQRVLIERPQGWEYLCFAAQLLHGRDAIEEAFLDYEVGFAESTGEIVALDEFGSVVSRLCDDALALIDTLMRLMQPAVQERAFGAPGVAGDPDRVLHLAARWTSVYRGMLDWASRVRGISAPAECRPALSALARFVDDPIHTYREFVDRLVEQTDEVPQALIDGRQLTVSLVLELRIPEEILSEYRAALAKIH